MLSWTPISLRSCAVFGLCLLGLSSIGTRAATPAPRDWAQQPAIVVVPSAERIVAIGDIHGDRDALVSALETGGLIAPGGAADVKWTGGHSVVVFTGDLIDKWNQGLPVLDLIRALAPAAEAQGGRVIVTMGNHEAEFLAKGSADDKAQEFLGELSTAGLAADSVASGTDPRGVGRFLRGLPFAARVGDWFFAHAGNSHGATLDELSSQLAHGVSANGFSDAVLQDPDSLLEARMHPDPWWQRAGDTAAAARARLATWVAALSARHLVIGHQPGNLTAVGGESRKKGQLDTWFDGLVFFIDAGMSRGVYSNPATVLVIEGSIARRVTAGGASTQLWPASR